MYGYSMYGTLIYSEEAVNNVDIDPYTSDLMKYLPLIYHGIKEIEEIERVAGKEIGLLKYSLDNTAKQVYIDSASWGLPFWERDLGITTDISKPDLFRQEIIKAKLRGRGTVTKELIKNICESFTNAEVEVIEQPSTFSFVVKFIGVRGIPPNMAGLIDEIENIKPAHLLYTFEYNFTWWDKVKELTWDQASSRTWDELRIYE